MLNKILLPPIKQHPVAVAIYTLYMAVWLLLCYLTYHYLIQGDGDVIEAILFYWYLCVSIPYLVVTIILSYQVKRHSGFYKDMATLIFIPMGLGILVFLEHGVIAYFNKGVS